MYYYEVLGHMHVPENYFRQYSTIYWKGIAVPLTRMVLIALSLACLGTRLEMSRRLDREHACSHPSFLRAMCGKQKIKIMLSTYVYCGSIE